MSNYTKGPWIAKGPDILAASDHTRIATCGITHNYADNAKLLKAAPDLAEALQAMVNEAQDIRNPSYQMALAALEKAGV